MKKLFSTFLLLFALSTCVQAQYLIESELLATYVTFDVQLILGAIGSPSDFNIDYDVELYKVNYNTVDVLGQPTTASGAVAIPKDYACSLPLGNYSHGTVVKKSDVPSNQSIESNIGIAMAASGYIITMHDYLGLGDGPGFHPYVHAKSEATAAIDMIRASKELLDQLAKPYNDQLFLFGYSQGGHGAMATHKEIEENPEYDLTVTASAPMSGPYDISGVQTQYLVDPIEYDSPGYLPYVVMAYQTAYDYLPQNLSDIFAPPYDTLLPTLFDGEHTFGEINAMLPAIPSEMIRPDVFEAFQTDPNHPLRLALQDNDVYDWNPSAPIHLYYCTNDEQVNFDNAAVAYDQLTANVGTIDSTNGGHLTHNGCVTPALLGGKIFFDSFRREGLSESYTIEGLEDGNITIAFSDADASDFTYVWTLDGVEIIDNNVNEWLEASPGTYSISIVPNNGLCSETVEVVIVPMSGVEDAIFHRWKAYPNPSQDFVNVYCENDLIGRTIEVFSKDGKLILSQRISANQERLNLESFSAGLYLLKVGTSKRKVVLL